MNIQTFDSAVAVAEAAARDAVEKLHAAIIDHGSATWVIAGGSTPNLAYEILADGYLDRLDWSKVTFILGDERIGPLDGPDNNWQVIETLFLQHIPEATFLRPKTNQPAQQAAREYELTLATLARSADQIPQFDLAWLGMGPDGHTLSLFPDHPDFNPSDERLVIAVHNSPKPPADRISLTIRALKNCQNIVVLATGESKRAALSQAFIPGSKLPIAQASAATPDTLWLLDEAAKP